uniref:Alpha/beta hydrolase fold-3 domain-containing protein n=1 Tax=Anolis carolinensis TaxID=28377 RepID=A0A803TXH4_ANOCA
MEDCHTSPVCSDCACASAILETFRIITNFRKYLKFLGEKIGNTFYIEAPAPPTLETRIETFFSSIGHDLVLDGVPVRMYQPRRPFGGKRRGILYFHGGIGQFGSVAAYDRLCRRIAKDSDSIVISVEYRLAPENPYPTQFLDCLKATVHFLKNVEDYGVDPASVIISGDSIGGTLASAVCQVCNLPPSGCFWHERVYRRTKETQKSVLLLLSLPTKPASTTLKMLEILYTLQYEIFSQDEILHAEINKHLINMQICSNL